MYIHGNLAGSRIMRLQINVLAFCFTIMVSPAHAGDSLACDAKQFCLYGTVCSQGNSIASDKLEGDFQGKASWHSDVFFGHESGRSLMITYCYYRVVRINDPGSLPVYWRGAGLKFLGDGRRVTGCVYACTNNDWDDKKGPKDHPIAGKIEFGQQPKNTSVGSWGEASAETWGPEAGWTATEQGNLLPIPRPVPPTPDTNSNTVVGYQGSDGAVVPVEFEARVMSDTTVQYAVRNHHVVPITVVWNIPKNDSIRAIEGPFTRSGIIVDKEKPYQRSVNLASQPRDADAQLMPTQSQAAIEIGGKPALIVAFPTFAPSNGRFEIDPVTFWDRGSPR
jgi:hypothetical protein